MFDINSLTMTMFIFSQMVTRWLQRTCLSDSIQFTSTTTGSAGIMVRSEEVTPDWSCILVLNFILSDLPTFEFFHNSRLIRRIQQNKIYKKFRDLTRNWTWITCLTVRHLNHYIRMFSVLMWGYNWILFMRTWFCPIHLIHLIGRKSLHFGKTRMYWMFIRT